MRAKWFFVALVLSIFAMAGAAPRRLNNFESLMKSLQSGHIVKVVIEYGKCKLEIDGQAQPAPEAIGGVKFEPWEYFAKGVVRNDKAYVVSSETVLISSARYGHVYNYVRVRIYEDQTVEITAKYLKTGSFEVVMDETFRGTISTAKDKNGVHLWQQ